MITGIVLAGGKSTRMEKEKGLIQFRGKPLILHIIENISPLCDEILISANNNEYNFLGFKVIPDEITRVGPAGGILSGLKRSKSNHCLVISCDMPLASTSFLKRINLHFPENDIAVCFHDDRLQPLCGFYDRSITENFDEKVRSGMYKMQDLVKSFDYLAINQMDMAEFPFEYYLRNVNSKTDLLKMERPKVFILTGPEKRGIRIFLEKIIEILDKSGKININPKTPIDGNGIISYEKEINKDLVIIYEFDPLKWADAGRRNEMDKLIKKTDRKLLVVTRDEIFAEAYNVFKYHSCQIFNIEDQITPESICNYILGPSIKETNSLH